VCAAGLLLLVEWLWVTDTERIEARLAGLGDAIEQRELAGALEPFSSEFSVRLKDRLVLGKSQIGIAAAAALNEGVVKRLDVREAVITFGSSGDTAISEVVFNATVRVGDAGGYPGTVRVKLAWDREPDAWRVTSIADVTGSAFFFEGLGNNRVPLWDRLMRYTKRTR